MLSGSAEVQHTVSCVVHRTVSFVEACDMVEAAPSASQNQLADVVVLLLIHGIGLCLLQHGLPQERVVLFHLHVCVSGVITPHEDAA